MDDYDKLVYDALKAQWNIIGNTIARTANNRGLFLKALRKMRADTMKMINQMDGMFDEDQKAADEVNYKLASAPTPGANLCSESEPIPGGDLPKGDLPVLSEAILNSDRTRWPWVAY